jgi:polyhydroxyalkanoate synthesis regulator protein
MTETPYQGFLKYQRSSYTSATIVFDADLNLHSIEELRELVRDGARFRIVDVETDEDVTQALLAEEASPPA